MDENNIISRGRPKKYEQGCKERYRETNYFNEYYHSHKIKIPCPICNKMVNKLKMAEHNKTKSCLRAKEEKCL